jgi:predicted ATPase with chaperone activity
MKKEIDMSDIKGQEHVKRGIEVALTGGHNVLFIGPPKSGKTMMIKALQALSPYSAFPSWTEGAEDLRIRTYEMRPCPCGHFIDPEKECHCTPEQIQKYLDKTTREFPMDEDEIEIHLEVPKLKLEHIPEKRRGERSKAIRERIIKSQCNFRPTELDKEAEDLLKLAILELGISARAYDKILRVASTIAQMDNRKIIEAHHISEAIGYRSLDRNLWG